ncbi:ORF3 [Duwamo virus]|uniref:ORF3 n=1 Tax=Duwamo virus TaxID=1888317 RepID=UPI00083F3522|nr:ORF3 [Duwamo virus]AOC55073.1 ORF3 [Duwamo virus]
MAAAAIGATAAAGASNIVSSGLTAGLQIYGNSLNNSQQFAYNDSVISRAEHAFTDNGLPKYMAYQSNSGTTPTKMYQISGGNFYSAGPVNSNLPMYTTTAQQAFHAAAPRPNARVGPGEPAIPNWGDIHNGMPMVPVGQNNRQGLGFGRYNIANNFVQGGPMLNANVRNADQHQAFARALQ